MASQVYNSGACFVYAGIGSSGTAVFVGTGERAPLQRVQRFWSPIFNDLAGDQDSFDDMYEGQRGLVTVRLTRWDQAVVSQLQSTPFVAGGAGEPGFDFIGDVGSAMMTEGKLYPLWVLYDYGAAGRFPKAAYTSGNMPPGRRWLGARLESPDDETKGTQANTVDLTWVCKRVYNPSDGSFSLYDTNMNGLPAPL